MSRPPAPPVDDDAGFLSRWSQRKARARAPEVPVPEVPSNDAAAQTAPADPPVRTPPDPAPAAAPAPEAPPPPTLDDVATLGRDSDFRRFVRSDVDGPVRNAALKKLFADPHYNVMDGLDTYIDDYGRPDPLPASMLAKMAQSKFLGLFTDTEEDTPATPPPGASAAPADDGTTPEPPAPDEDPDLRLQPDDAAAGESPEPGAGEDPGRER